MDTVFREKQVETPAGDSFVEGTPVESVDMTGDATVAKDPTEFAKIIGKGYLSELMGYGDLVSGDFHLKMETSKIDKYIQETLEAEGMEKTRENYKRTLERIEAQLGTVGLLFKERIKKVAEYASILSKMRTLEQMKKKYIKQD